MSTDEFKEMPKVSELYILQEKQKEKSKSNIDEGLCFKLHSVRSSFQVHQEFQAKLSDTPSKYAPV